MEEVMPLLIRFPCLSGISEQLFFRDRLVRVARQLRNDLCVVRESGQVAFGQPATISPLLNGRRSIAEPLCDRRKTNKSNRACHRTHWCESVHRKWKVSRDLKCKDSGANSAGAGRHPNDNILGATSGGQQGCGPRVHPFRDRARARCLAKRCPEVAGRRRIASSEESHHSGHQSWRQYRMAEDWARLKIR